MNTTLIVFCLGLYVAAFLREISEISETAILEDDFTVVEITPASIINFGVIIICMILVFLISFTSVLSSLEFLLPLLFVGSGVLTFR